MLFNSYIFIFVFLPITLFLFYCSAKLRLVKLAIFLLTLSSLFFYSYWNFFPPEGQTATPQYLWLILISIVFNYLMSFGISAFPAKSKWSKIALTFGIGVNLASIAYFKYTGFFIGTINNLSNSSFSIPQVSLPLAISFYTFTQIAYLVDVYREKTKGQNYDLLTYALFVIFFPQLIAGPILRHDELIPQFKQLKNFFFSQKNFALGLSLFGMGLAKKVLISDNLSSWVFLAFGHSSELSFTEAWVGALSYTFQLYFDFSGYSDMAIGLGWMFNINLPFNFNSPYKATSITDFWRRWHITLSNFLRDYLYIPLGGSRRGEIRRYANLIVTMLLGGLWHGAGWTFVVWGGLHGLCLSINHGWRKLNIALPKLLAGTLTFLVVVLGWVLFRASSLEAGLAMITTMLGGQGIVIPGEPEGKLAVLTGLGIQLKSWQALSYLPAINGSKAMSILSLVLLILSATLLPNSQQIARNIKPNWWWATSLGILTSICLLSLNRVSEFLYFQF